MESETIDNWETVYDDRFALKETNGDDTIKLKRPRNDGGSYDVIGEIGDKIHHTRHELGTHADEQVAVLELLAEHEIEYNSGDPVYVVSADFGGPLVQTGVVAYNEDMYDAVHVSFTEDPYTGGGGSRIIAVDTDEMLHMDAGTVEVLSFIGREDLLEPSDFGDSNE